MKCFCGEGEMKSWDRLDLWHCVSCGHSMHQTLHENPYKTDDGLADHFAELDSTPESDMLCSIRLGTLQTAGKLSGSIVDLGCSVGSFVRHAQHSGYNAVGFDCSPKAVQIARENGLLVDLVHLESLNGEIQGVDCITLFDVIEHISDPVALLQHVSGALNDGGIIVLSTPDASGLASDSFEDWRHYKPGEHIHYFTEASLRSCLELSGYSVLSVTGTEDRVRKYVGRSRNIMTATARVKS